MTEFAVQYSYIFTVDYFHPLLSVYAILGTLFNEAGQFAVYVPVYGSFQNISGKLFS